MALNVYNQTFNTGIDRSVLKEVSQEILKRAAAKNGQYTTSNSSFNTTVFRPQDIGIDLYNGRVDAKTQRQIALNNSGLNIQLNQEVLNSIKYLNTQAAQNVQKNVEGKISVALNESQGQAQRSEAGTKFNSIISLAAGKDKHGSNPSYKGELLFVKKEKETEDNTKNIFNTVF